MNIDIRKDGQLYGPHTVEELKALVARGDVGPSDIVIKEYGEEVTVGAFLEQSRPLKLKVLPPAVPEPRLSPPPPPPPPSAARPPGVRPPVPPRAPAPRPSTEPPLLAAAARQKNAGMPPVGVAGPVGEVVEKPAGHLIWVTVLLGLFSVWVTYKHLMHPGIDSDSAIGAALGQTVGAGAMIGVLIRVFRKKARTPRVFCIGLMVGFSIKILLTLAS